MRFALMNNKRAEATPKQKGVCQCCGQSVIAKCGKQRVWHWAHDSKKDCNNRWETEGEWHRNWKGRFPLEWQEVPHHCAKTGEKHIADVRLANGYVVEFQHSRIDPLEQAKREAAYGNMLWVVDGTRLKRDYPRFVQSSRYGWKKVNQATFLVSNPDKCFPASWLKSTVPVFFDFQGFPLVETMDAGRNVLWCLNTGRMENQAIDCCIGHEEFVSISSRGVFASWCFKGIQDAGAFIDNELRYLAWLKRENSFDRMAMRFRQRRFRK